MTEISLIAFDGDDTLWGSQTYFDTVEHVYCDILAPYAAADEVSDSLLATEQANHPLMGTGSKSFIISLIENAIQISKGSIQGTEIEQIIGLGKELLRLPGKPFDGVRKTLEKLQQTGRYKMVVFAEGELLDQENKFERSGLRPYFDDLVIVSDKTSEAYRKLCNQYNTKVSQLLTIGNSFSTDINPALKIGSWGVHIPYYIENHLENPNNIIHPRLLRIANFSELEKLLYPNPNFIDASEVS